MIDLYPLPKKIEFLASTAKWTINSSQSVLLLCGLDELKSNSQFEAHSISNKLNALIRKAKALEIPIVDLNQYQMLENMALLGEYVASQKQIVIVGRISASIKQFIQHLSSVAEQLCIIDDAIILENQKQHIQWVDHYTQVGVHHMNTATLVRLWELSAPTEFILSEKGILLSIAEYLEIEILEVNPHVDLRKYGLDSVAMVSLIGLWRANGAEIDYERMNDSCTLAQLLPLLVLNKNS